MDDIFVNAFNLNNMVNMTQMTLSSDIDFNGQLENLKINGIAIFGQDCYKISQLPEIFNNSLELPAFNQ